MLGPEGRKQLRQASKIATVGIEMGLAVVLGLFGGRWIDGKLDTAPLFLFIGLFFGLATGFKRLWDVSKKNAHKPTTPDYEPPDTGYDDSDWDDTSWDDEEENEPSSDDPPHEAHPQEDPDEDPEDD